MSHTFLVERMETEAHFDESSSDAQRFAISDCGEARRGSCKAAPVRRPKEDNVRSSNPLVANWGESLCRVAKASVWAAAMVAATTAVANGQILPGIDNPVSVD